jgi:hypothetical protein
MADKNKLQVGYTVHRYISNSYGNYEHLEVTFYNLSNCLNDELFKITYQNDSDSINWYAFHIELRSANMNQFTHASKVLKQVMKSDYCLEPSALLDRLDALKIPHVVYDARVFPHYIPLSECLPETYHRYIDDYRALGNMSCDVSVVSDCENNARTLIRAELATRLLSDDLKKFLAHDEPIMIADHGSKVNRTPARELIISTIAKQAA